MFVQYLRGRRSELLALRATSTILERAGEIFPVVEPVAADAPGLARVARAWTGANSRLAIITNPAASTSGARVQDMLADGRLPDGLGEHSLLVPTLLVRASLTAGTASRFFQRYGDRRTCVVHHAVPSASAAREALTTGSTARGDTVCHIFDSRTPSAYQAAFASGSRVLLTDGFRRQLRNADYNGPEFFSDGPSTYVAHGFQGFGDYSVIGDHFEPRGGRPRAVAIHLTFANDDRTIWIHHFVSDSNDTTANVAGKFLEAGDKLKRAVRRSPALGETHACRELLRNISERTFPGLPKLKELAMRHHIELVGGLLS